MLKPLRSVFRFFKKWLKKEQPLDLKIQGTNSKITIITIDSLHCGLFFRV